MKWPSVSSVSGLGLGFLILTTIVSATEALEDDDSLSIELATQSGQSSPSRSTVKKQLESELPAATEATTTMSMEALLPKEETLFQKDAVDRVQLLQMDCHLRNVDYCYAGILGSAQRALPETDSEFENRCDEMKATSACLAMYNQRCSTFKVFAALAPFANLQSGAQQLLPPDMQTAELPETLDQLLLNRNRSDSSGGRASGARPQAMIRIADLLSLCEPSSKGTEANKVLRNRIFQVAKCINERVPYLRPCLEDLKTSIQLFYEPSRSLPLKPSCCAISRFRDCASKAMDGVCGLSSFDQLEEGLSSGPTSMIMTVQKVCRQAAKFDSPYCQEILPPRGLKAPPRRGHKASKLSKALDLIQFAPAAQESM